MTGKVRDRSGYYQANKEKFLERDRKRRNTLKGKESRKNSQLRFYYGISLEDYNQMFSDQEGCCKICKRHQSELKRKLNVDHCHDTKIVRALLCNQCNQALGLLKENPKTLKAMLEYVS